MTKRDDGFTLIELLITIAIIGILAAISVPLYMGQQKKAAMTEAISNLQNLRLLEEQFFAENGRYAPDDDNDPATVQSAVGTAAIQGFLRGFRPGNDLDLSYNYAIWSPAGTCVCSGTNLPGRGAADPGAPAAPQSSFTACACPKAGTRVQGTSPFFINDRNQNNF